MSDEPFRWLHLSDFHVGKDEYGQISLFRSILDNVQVAMSQDQTPDAVFISGDIAQSGKNDQYQTFLDDFFWPLQSMLSSTPCHDRIFVVPGNHDVDRLIARAVKTHGVLSDIPTFFDPTADAQFDRSPLFSRFEAFMAHDPTTINPHWIASVAGRLCRRIAHGDKQFGVLCLNSAWLCCGDDDRHNLSFGKAILEQGLEEMKDVALRIVLVHHPIEWLLDDEIGAIRSLLARRRPPRLE